MTVTKSPYFRKRKTPSPSLDTATCTSTSTPSEITSTITPKRSPATTTKRSSHFTCSPLSCFGSVARLGPLLFTLSGERPTGSCSRRFSSCTCSSAVCHDAIRHFYCCDQFRTRFEANEQQFASESQTCLEISHIRIQHAARHLCSHRCYMRVFSPVREWIYLRQAIHEVTDYPLDSILEGWACRLNPEFGDGESMFANEKIETQKGPTDSPPVSVVFVSPDFKHFTSKVEVIKFLLDKNQVPEVIGRPCPSKRRLFVEEDYPESHWLMCPKESVDSPLGLLEELFSDPWKLLISTIFLNRTSRVQVDAVLYQFLTKWPTPAAAVNAIVEEMALVIKPLGLRNRRARGIIRFSNEYLCLLKTKEQQFQEGLCCEEEKGDLLSVACQLSKEDIFGLYNCGQYAYAAYQIFIKNELRIDPQDHALNWYVEFQRARQGIE